LFARNAVNQTNEGGEETFLSLSTFTDMLPHAKEHGYAIGSFNVWDVYSARSITSTAEKMRSPVIVSLWQPELDFAGEKQLYELCISFAKAVSVPVAIFIDHAKDIQAVQRAIKLGATSVMIDASHLPLEENIALTARAAELAHSAGVSIEGEIGVLGEEEGADPDEALYTDVYEAQRFVLNTDVDALAVAIGNAHGYYKKTPKLDLDRLTAIGGRVDTPLVLHGGSGIPSEDIRAAIDRGITKINIGAEPRTAFMKGLRASLAELDESEKFPHRIFPPALEGHARLIEEKMELLGSCGRG
jgi:fructose-bisphosphate aldolase class II